MFPFRVDNAQGTRTCGHFITEHYTTALSEIAV